MAYRIDNASAAAVKPARGAVGPQPDAHFQNPSGGTPGTIVDADWAEAHQEEIVGLVEHAGLTADKADDTQLVQAVGGAVALVSGATDTGAGASSYHKALVAAATSSRANGTNAAVVGGTGNLAGANDATCIGGDGNEASGLDSSCVAGTDHVANAADAVCVGGQGGEASQTDAGTFAGADNTASGIRSACVAGTTNTASGIDAVCVGGQSATANTTDAATLGGFQPTASGLRSAVVGGYDCAASGDNAAVVGGQGCDASGSWSFVAGSYDSGAAAADSVVLASAYTSCSTSKALALGNDPSGTPARADANQTIRLESVGGNVLYEGSLSNGAVSDFAELFPVDSEIVAGSLVTLAGDRAREAVAGDVCVGIVSTAPGLCGNAAWSGWAGRWERDAYGRRLTDPVDCVRWPERRAANPAHEAARDALQAARKDSAARRAALAAEHAAEARALRTAQRAEVDAARVRLSADVAAATSPGLRRQAEAAAVAELGALRARHDEARGALVQAHNAADDTLRAELRALAAPLVRTMRETPREVVSLPAYDGPEAAAPCVVPDDATRYQRQIPRQAAEYDPTRPYQPRRERPAEWAPVALTGIVPARVDETVGAALRAGSGPVYLAPSAAPGVGRAATAGELRPGAAAVLVLGLAAPGVARVLVR